VSTLQFTIPAGRSYTTEWSADLIAWTPFASGASTGAQIQVNDIGTGTDRRFYRLRLAE
jgi:hypothetical protein